jgi:hypothetical protein
VLECVVEQRVGRREAAAREAERVQARQLAQRQRVVRECDAAQHEPLEIPQAGDSRQQVRRELARIQVELHQLVAGERRLDQRHALVRLPPQRQPPQRAHVADRRIAALARHAANRQRLELGQQAQHRNVLVVLEARRAQRAQPRELRQSARAGRRHRLTAEHQRAQRCRQLGDLQPERRHQNARRNAARGGVRLKVAQRVCTAQVRCHVVGALELHKAVVEAQLAKVKQRRAHRLQLGTGDGAIDKVNRFQRASLQVHQLRKRVALASAAKFNVDEAHALQLTIAAPSSAQNVVTNTAFHTNMRQWTSIAPTVIASSDGKKKKKKERIQKK